MERQLAEPRRVAQRILITLLALQERARSAADLVGVVCESLGEGAYGMKPVYALRRDIQCLRGAGFGITFARVEGVYRLESSPLSIKLGEARVRALALVREAFGPGVPHATEVQDLVARVAVMLAPEERRLLERRSPLRVELTPADSGAGSNGVLDRLEHALRMGLQVCFGYGSIRGGEPRERRVEPLELAFRQGHLYLRAYSLEAEQPREYRVDRIRPESLRVLPNRRPPGRRSPRRYRLRYRLGAALARVGVSERFPGQQVEHLADGCAVVTAEIESLFWAERTLLGYGEHVEVLEPAELRERIRQAVRQMGAAYERGDG